MAIELTTATTAQLSGINSFLRKSIFPMRGLDLNSNAKVFDATAALEGGSVPDGSTDDYTKTYDLGVELENAMFIFLSNTGNDLTSSPTRNMLIEMPLTFYNVTPTLSAGFPGSSSYNVQTLISAVLGAYVTKDYTQATRLDTFSSGAAEKLEDGNFRTSFPAATWLKTYSQLQNTLIGYYGFTSNSSLFKTGAGGSGDIKSVLKSAYLSGNNLILLFKKYASTTGADFSGTRFGVVY